MPHGGKQKSGRAMAGWETEFIGGLNKCLVVGEGNSGAIPAK
jgi:hypothetical protein